MASSDVRSFLFSSEPYACSLTEVLNLSKSVILPASPLVNLSEFSRSEVSQSDSEFFWRVKANGSVYTFLIRTASIFR